MSTRELHGKFALVYVTTSEKLLNNQLISYKQISALLQENASIYKKLFPSGTLAKWN